MKVQDGTYRNSWDRESIVEHTLRHNSTEEKQRFRGSVDFLSPSRRMMQKENCGQTLVEEIREDATTCSNILRVLFIAQKASLPKGISRGNCCAGLRVYSAISYHIDGKTYATIGDELGGRERQIPERYASRFRGWSSEHCEDMLSRITPCDVIGFCCCFVAAERTLGDVLDELRIALFDLLCESKSEALRQGLSGGEVYSDILKSDFKKSISELLKA